MIKKCDHTGCTKAGVCRAPKTRELEEYWWFCKEHAAEYNKNWNYYANMSPDEINDEWERETFGIADKDIKQANKNKQEYIDFINDFLTGRNTFDKIPTRHKTISSQISNAFGVFDLPITSSWNEVASKYRTLAKKHHPDTAKNKTNAMDEFTRITEAYNTLKKYFNK